MEPISALAASAIAKLAFDEFIKSGAGELAKQSLVGAGGLVKSLRDKIATKFKGNPKAEAALAEVESNGTPEALNKVSKYLDIEMTEDEAFATDIRQVAQQIINIENQSINIQNQPVSTRNYVNYGGKQTNVDTVQGDLNIN